MDKRPNFLLIVADDLGFSDPSCYGGEIQTPNIDRLAKQGVRFTDFHTTCYCSPTRSMLLSGTDCHMAGVGVMFEARGGDPERFNRPGHEGYMNHDVAALPELLQDAGYHTLMSGKWHLGFRDGFIPCDRGFDRSWALLPACSNHYGWEPQWDNGEYGRPNGVPGTLPMLYCDEDKRYTPEPNTTSDPEKGFYSSTFYVSNLLKYFDDRKTSPTDSKKPFFAYLPFAAPHWPLQCPKENREKYKGMYDDGPDALRLRRLEGLKARGLIDPNVVPHKVVASTPEWDDMTPEERKMSSRAMEVYAGTVDRMDQEMGRVLDYLEESGEIDNTVIIFMSDNGAEGGAYEASPVMGPRLMSVLDRYYDNSYDNLGNYNSFIWYGPRWAQASTAPNRLYKSFTTEGGIRVPMVLRYPGFTKIQPGSILPTFATCMDIMPTLLTLAGVQHPNPSPETPRSKASYRGRQVYSMRGKDWVPYMIEGKAVEDSVDARDAIYGNNVSVGWEMHAKCSLRRGKWKIVNLPAGQFGSGGWQLYDLSVDQGEVNDLAKERPDILGELIREWGTWVEETGTAFGPPMKGGKNQLPPDMIGGDPTEDMRAWMKVGHGNKLGSESGPRPDVEAWRGFQPLAGRPVVP